MPDVVEETLTPPPSWRRDHHLRRGGWFTEAPPPDPSARAATFLRKHEEVARRGLRRAEAEIGAAGLAALDGEVTGFGVAAVVAAVTGAAGWQRVAAVTESAEPWASSHGPVIAAEAAVALAGLSARRVVQRAGDGRTVSDVPYHGWPDVRQHFSAGVRARLAVAGDEDHAAAEAVLAPYRREESLQRIMTSFVLPTRRDWVDEDVAMIAAGGWKTPAIAPLLSSVWTSDHLETLADAIVPYLLHWPGGTVSSLVEGTGADALPVLLRWFDNPDHPVEGRRRCAAAIGALPSDAAFAALVERAADPLAKPGLQAAAARFPRRATRLLPAGPMLRAHVAAFPRAAAEVRPELPAASATLVRAALAVTAAVTEAPPERLPAVLTDPPWTRRRRAPKPVVIEGLTADFPAEVHWRPGEREAYAARGVRWFRQFDHLIDRGGWAKMVTRLRSRDYGHLEPVLVAEGPDAVTLPLLAGGWTPRYRWSADEWLPPILARYELAALPAATRYAREHPAAGPALAPFTGPEPALLHAGWLPHRSARETARAWILRHPAVAARGVVPAALAKPGPDRRNAEAVLLFLAAAGHRDSVTTAAEGYGPEAAAAVTALLDADPLWALPARMPVLGDWADPAALPRIALRDGSGVLPLAAAGHLLAMLSISRPGDVYAGLTLAADVLDPAGLAEFGWAAFARWRAAGMPAKDAWVLDALGVIGDDETVRRLAPVIRAWPGERAHARAVAGLDVLAEIGTGVALMHLHGIAQRARFKGLKDRANEKIVQVAAGLGLTAEQLADRLVPDLGLSADGTLTLDGGFVARFDEQLRPYLTDAHGERLTVLPKAATEAAARFAALKKDVRTLAGDQLRRLEAAMTDRRRWSGAEFREFLAGHPLMFHLVRRLVWAVHDGAAVVRTFRVAEDRSLADDHDESLTVADDATIGIAHPAETDLTAWAEVFADYRIVQPFPQLDREVFTLGPDGFGEFEKVTVPSRRVLGMERRGWRRTTPADAGVQDRIDRPVSGGRTLVVRLDPGIAVGEPDMLAEQELCGIELLGHGPAAPLDPVTASELVRDLRELTGRRAAAT